MDKRTCEESIDRWFAGREEELTAAIARLVAIPSLGVGDEGPGAPFGRETGRALDEAVAIAREWGLKAENLDGYVCTADLNGGEDALHVLAHLDIVAPGSGWDTDPYAVVRQGDLLYGRGVDDDKGPALMALMAMRCLKELNLPLKKNVRAIFGTDEETGSRDIAWYYSGHPYAPAAVSPDAEFPVIHIEKGHYAPEFSHTLPGESELPRVTRLLGGIRVNVVPNEARATVMGLSADNCLAFAQRAVRRTGVELDLEDVPDGVELIARGREAHAATPDEGNNAITALLEVLSALPLADTDSAGTMRALSEMFPHGDNAGEALHIAQSDGESGALSLTLSLLKMEGGEVRGQFDARTPLCASEENCGEIVRERMTAAGFACPEPMGPGHRVDPESPFVRTLLECYEACTGKKGCCVAIGGGTYVHNIPGGVAFGAGDSDFDSHLHSANERVRLSALLDAGRIYANVMAELCK